MAVPDIQAALGHFSSAVRAFTVAGDCRQAAMASASMGQLFSTYLTNKAAATAWFERAARLVEHEPPCIEQGWVAVAATGCDVDDPAVLLARAELALDRARRFGDVNLESKALADAGLALVQAGELAKGMALLDESMALVCGPANNPEFTGRSVCSFFTACYYAADFDRASSWAEDLRRHGLIGPVPGAQIFLAAHCDAVQATLLGELGRWSDAEALLSRSIEAFESRMGAPSWHPAIALAELRIRQGRLAEAEVLLLGKEFALQALLPAARLHLARGDLDLARATATRGLRAIVDDRLRGAELVAVLVDVELAAGDVTAAEVRCADLEALAGDLEVPGLQARTAGVRARVRAASGDRAGSIAILERALDLLPASGTPFLGATLLVELARLHNAIGNRAMARVEATRAAAALSALDVVLAPADTALLERLTAPVEPPAAVSRTTAVICGDGRSWVVEYGDMRARLAPTKGLRYLAELVGAPGVERHALDLVDRVEGVAAGPAAVDRRALGDAGEIADSRARAAYRRRIESLRAEVDEALGKGDDDRAQALQDEADRLVRALAEAFGLGGRSRKASSAAEKARLNVTRALRSAVARVSDVLPEAGAALDRRLRTGLYCAYEPVGDDIRWIVQSELNRAATA